MGRQKFEISLEDRLFKANKLFTIGPFDFLLQACNWLIGIMGK